MKNFNSAKKLISREFTLNTSTLRFESDIRPRTQLEVDDMRLFVVPPGPVHMECTLSKVVIDINLGPAVGALALNSDVVKPGPPLTSGYYAYFPSGSNFKVEAENTTHTVFLEVSPARAIEWFEAANLNPNFEPPGFPYIEDKIVGELGQLAAAVMRNDAFGDQHADLLMMEAIILGIAARCIVRAQNTAPSAVTQSAQWSHMRDNARLSRAIDYAMTHLSDPNMKIADLALQAGLSSPHFAEVFKRAKGASPYAFILSERLKLAKQMITETSMPLSEIAYASGFSSQSHMTTNFNKFLGITPAKLRK